MDAFFSIDFREDHSGMCWQQLMTNMGESSLRVNTAIENVQQSREFQGEKQVEKVPYDQNLPQTVRKYEISDEGLMDRSPGSEWEVHALLFGRAVLYFKP